MRTKINGAMVNGELGGSMVCVVKFLYLKSLKNFTMCQLKSIFDSVSFYFKDYSPLYKYFDF